MPPGFRYHEAFEKGRPEHDRYDDFCIRHPSMPASRRAKIFSPFDALKGFSEAIAAKDERYVPRRELSGDELRILDETVSALRAKITGCRAADRLRIRIRVEYFALCSDPNSSSCGILGQYHRISGICREISAAGRFIRIGEHRIPFEDITRVEIEDSGE